MSYQPPPEPSNRDLQVAMVEIRNLLTRMQPSVDMLNRKMDNVTRALYGDKDENTPGALKRLANVEDAVESLQKRNLITDTRTQTLVWLAGFLGITNIAGILAIIGFLSGIIHR